MHWHEAWLGSEGLWLELWEALEKGVKLGRAWDALTWGLARKWRPMAGVGQNMVLAWIDLGQR